MVIKNVLYRPFIFSIMVDKGSLLSCVVVGTVVIRKYFGAVG